MAPIRLSPSMFSRWISLSGVSRDHQHQTPPLLQRDVGGSGDQFAGDIHDAPPPASSCCTER